MSHFIAFDLPESIEKSPDIYGALLCMKYYLGA